MMNLLFPIIAFLSPYLANLSGVDDLIKDVKEALWNLGEFRGRGNFGDVHWFIG